MLDSKQYYLTNLRKLPIFPSFYQEYSEYIKIISVYRIYDNIILIKQTYFCIKNKVYICFIYFVLNRMYYIFTIAFFIILSYSSSDNFRKLSGISFPLNFFWSVPYRPMSRKRKIVVMIHTSYPPVCAHTHSLSVTLVTVYEQSLSSLPLSTL